MSVFIGSPMSMHASDASMTCGNQQLDRGEICDGTMFSHLIKWEYADYIMITCSQECMLQIERVTNYEWHAR